MAKFIEVHHHGESKLFNIEAVLGVEPAGKCANIYFMPNYTYEGMRVDESYIEVRTMLANATGGLPIPQRSARE